MTARRSVPLLVSAILVLLLVACARAEGTPSDDGADEEGMPRPPAGSLEADGTVYPFGLGSYCWSAVSEHRDGEEVLAVCADAMGYITAEPYAEAAPGATLTIAGDLAALDFAIRYAQLFRAPDAPIASGDDPAPWEAWHPKGDPLELSADGPALVLPADLEPGRYLLALEVGRSGGSSDSASYAAIVEVE